ncbi:putative clathrin heavy chain, partial [Cardiosporidium cionae]
IMTHTGSQFSVEWMQQFFGKLPPDASLEIMTDMLRSNRQNMNTVVSMAIKFHEQIGTGALIKMFESFSSYEGIFYFLGFVLSSNQDPDVHFKYIEAASKLNHIQEVERCCRESTFYDPIRVKDFLKQAKLADPRPLICVCDLHHFVDEMTEYLYKNGLMKYIEVYVLKVNSKNAPIVIGTLIDLDCPEDFVDSLLVSIRGMCPVGSLIEEMEKRNRLRILLPWLEARMNEGNQETELHNAVAKIYIDTNRDPEQFLKNNAYYDSKIVGKYCEDRDPHLAFTCYKRAWGTCDAELVEVTNVNGLFRLQARYLVERRSPELWLAVLSQETEYRRSVIDQVVSTALPESTNAEEISVAVKAFIAAKLPNELIDLLEKIVLHNSDFSSYKNLQNLLILTAVSARPAKVMDYINRLENYDGTHIARLAAENGLFEEAFQIYKKFEMNGEAIEVLLKNSENLERASDFAAKCNLSYVWSKLASQQLAGGFVSDAIDSYLRAEDGSNYKDVIEVSKQCSAYEQLVKYLQMARIPNKDQLIDSELVYALAKCDHLIEMAEFVGGSNTANVQTVGDRLFEEEHFEAAKKLYGSIPNHSKMAICYVRLGDFLSAVEAAKKANSPKTWKEVSFACVEAKEFKCAHTAGLNLIIHPDHLDELIMQYEYRGMFDDLIVLLEAGIASDRTHVGMFTEMGIAYVKYKPEKLMEFCRLHCGRINISKLIRVCERHLQWKPAVYLHVFYDECDQAIALMMAHNSCAFEHEEFLKVIQKISNSDLYYQAITFYHDFYPMQLHSLLKTLEKKLDPSKVVSIGKNLHCLPLIEEYLLEVQHTNLIPVNETINELLLESCNFDRLRQSVSTFTNFDQIATAKRLQDHSSLEVRRISALLYQLNKRYKDSLDVSLGDKQYQDAMITVAASASSSLVEELLRFFTEHDQINCFTACLQICYDFVKPDVAIEMAWKKGWTDAAMPYTIQIIHEFSNRLDILDKKEEIREKKEEKQKSAPNDFLPDMMGGPMLPGMGNLALMPPPFQGQQMQPPSTSFVDSMQPRQPMFNMNNFQTSNFTPPRYH